MTDTRAYDPLNVDELGRNTARALMGHPSSPLPPAASFAGAGVYTIHYSGSFPPYADLAENAPIYVGKADHPGRRQGRTARQQAAPVLFRRLSEHARSIASTINLEPGDFSCRWRGCTEFCVLSSFGWVHGVGAPRRSGPDGGSGATGCRTRTRPPASTPPSPRGASQGIRGWGGGSSFFLRQWVRTARRTGWRTAPSQLATPGAVSSTWP